MQQLHCINQREAKKRGVIDRVGYAQGYAQGLREGEAKGRAEAIEEYVSILKKELEFCEKHGDLVVKLAEQLKEKQNEH